jgi:hypothetical protein
MILCPLIVFIGLFESTNAVSAKGNINSASENNGLVFYGHWKNQDNSLMFMQPVSMTKYLVEWKGWYHSGVSFKNMKNKNSTPGNYSLTGRSYIMEGNQITRNVVWANDQAQYYSVTAWNGFVESNQKGDIKMEANWILTYGKASNWNDTMIGEDFFIKLNS